MNLIDEAQELLLHQFSQSPMLKALIRALVKPFAEAYAELNKLHHGRYIDDAHGATLDVIGKIVGQERLGMSDEDYRPWIKVAIYLNNSSGTAENMLTLLSILFGKKPPVGLQEYAPNDVIFTFFENPKFPIKTLFAIMRRAAPVTTKCQFIKADQDSHRNHSKVATLNTTRIAFRFDQSPFSESYFADFYEGESYER
jgi:hypothetical protein